MKKIILSIAAVLILLAAGTFFYISKYSNNKTISPESILPEKTIALVQVKNLENTIVELSKTKLGQNLKSINIETVAAKLGSTDFNEKTAKFKKAFNSETNKSLFYNFFGLDFSIALTSVPFSQNPENTGLVLITKPKTDARLVEMLSSVIPNIKKKGVTEFNGKKIYSSSYSPNPDNPSAEPINFFHFSKDKYLIVTFSMEEAKSVIEADSTGKNLASTEKFKAFKDSIDYKTREYLFFVENKTLIKEVSLAAKTKAMKDLFESAALIDHMISASFKISDSKTLTNLRFKQKAQKNFKPENPDKFIAMVPEKSIMFLWQNNFDLKSFIKEILITDEKIENFNQTLTFELGVKPQDLYKDSAGDLGLIFTGLNKTGIFPVPEMAIVMKKEFSGHFNEILSFLIKSKTGSLNIKEKDMDGTKIKYIPVPIHKDLQPSWCVINDYFIISMNLKTIEALKNTVKTEKNISTTDDYKFVLDNRKKDVNTISFIKTDSFLMESVEFLELTVRMAAMGNPAGAQRLEIIIKDIISPLFKGLTIYKATGTSGSFDGDIFTGTSITKVEK